jgi:hypothetical protein
MLLHLIVAFASFVSHSVFLFIVSVCARRILNRPGLIWTGVDLNKFKPKSKKVLCANSPKAIETIAQEGKAYVCLGF